MGQHHCAFTLGNWALCRSDCPAPQRSVHRVHPEPPVQACRTAHTSQLASGAHMRRTKLYLRANPCYQKMCRHRICGPKKRLCFTIFKYSVWLQNLGPKSKLVLCGKEERGKILSEAIMCKHIHGVWPMVAAATDFLLLKNAND